MPQIALRRSLFVCLVSMLLWVGLLTEARAAGPEMVVDIATGPNPYQVGPHQFFTLRGKVLFFASDNDYGPALWASDGTPQGTSLLAVLCPACGEARLMGATSTVAFYSVQLDTGEPERPFSVWRTDGTRAGTYPVTGMLRMPAYPQLTVSTVGGRLAYFNACTREQGCEIWSSDGTLEGTGPVADRVPGPDSFRVLEMATLGDQAYILGQVRGNMGLWRADAASRTVTRVRGLRSEPAPRLLTVLGNRLFFLAQAEGLELWTSDGTTAGTSVVSAYAPADPFLATQFLKPIDGRLYFLADDGAHGIELWSADGTGGGLTAVTDFRPYYPFGPDGWYAAFVPESLESVGGRLLFAANNDGRTGLRLWTSRGRPGSTQRLTDCPGGCPELPLTPRFARLGTRVVFAGRNARYGMEPWISDGTGPGTRVLRDLVPGPGYSAVRAFTSTGSRVFFERYIEEREPVEMWATDGTPAGTVFVTMGMAAESHYQPPRTRMELGALGAWTLFADYSPVLGVPQLRRSDGTPAGTGAVFEWDRQAGSDPRSLSPFEDHVLFVACRSYLNELWVSGGTAGTTDRVDVALGPCGHPVLSKVVDVGGTGGIGVFRLSREYADNVSYGVRLEIWRTDGTAAGTAPLTSFPNAVVNAPVPLAGKALFQVIPAVPGPAPTNGASLWVTDGTAAGTEKRVDLPGVFAYYETGLGSEAFFVGVNHAANEVRVWRTDGTAAGTFPITPVVSDLTHSFVDPELTRLGNRVYFVVRPQSGGIQIWSTDGTPQGTGPAVTAAAGMAEPDSLWAAGGLLFFRALETGGSRRVLWRTDGTPAGTFALGADLSDDLFTFYPITRFATLGDEVFFRASDGAHGAELWKSDGTREGTVPVKDIFTGPAGSYPMWLAAAGGRVYFSAIGGGGMELWSSDGTAEGTRREADIAPGPSWSAPWWLTAAEDQLFFTADDGIHGRELWRLPLP